LVLFTFFIDAFAPEELMIYAGILQFLWASLTPRYKRERSSICWLLDTTEMGITQEVVNLSKDAYKFDYFALFFHPSNMQSVHSSVFPVDYFATTVETSTIAVVCPFLLECPC
jgi:hypothetical protein